MSSNHDIDGLFPEDINKLTNLEHLAVSRNRMTGSIPSQLCELTTLRHLFLGFNEFEGNVPSCIDGLNNLETLFVSFTLFLKQLDSKSGLIFFPPLHTVVKQLAHR